MTRLVLDKVQELGGVRMAVIAEVGVETHSIVSLFAGQGMKTPRYVLIEDDRGLKAFAPHGAPVSLSEIETCCAPLLERFRKASIDEEL